MRKGKIIRLITAVSLSISLLAAGGIYASAQTPEKELAVPREFKDVASATVDKGTETYDTSYESDINDLNSQMISKGYRQSPTFSNNCIVAYYRSGESVIRHFAKVDAYGVVSSKMDHMELVIHDSYRAFENMSNGFGDQYLFYVKE